METDNLELYVLMPKLSFQHVNFGPNNKGNQGKQKPIHEEKKKKTEKQMPMK